MTDREFRSFGALAAFIGLVLLYFYQSMRLKSYLAEGFHHFVLLGGLGILILGLYALLLPREKAAPLEKPSPPCCSGDDHDHVSHHHHHEAIEEDQSHGPSHNLVETDHSSCCGHDHHDEGHSPVTASLIILIPLLIAMTFSEDEFSLEGKIRQGAMEPPPATSSPFTLEDLEKNVSKNAAGQFQLSLIDAYFAGGDPEVHQVLSGIPVEIEGRLMPEKGFEDGSRRRIYRTFISCCAADATIAGISLLFDTPSLEIPDGDWVRAGGTMEFEQKDGKFQTVIRGATLLPADEPYSEFLQRNQ